MKYIIGLIIAVSVFVVSCQISTTAYEETLIEACNNNPVVSLLVSKVKIECRVLNHH